MFTGIIKDLGKIKGIARKTGGAVLTAESEILAPLAIGDSVAVDGVCLTVVAKKAREASFDLSEHTLQATTLRKAFEGCRVNLETALKVGDSLGGHFVTGHVDCVGKVTHIEEHRDSVSIMVKFPPKYSGLVVDRGSVAVDGVSLTIAEAENDDFKVNVIPHTMRETTLGVKRRGDDVNLEFDILGKFALKLKDQKARPEITEDYLKDKGFI